MSYSNAANTMSPVSQVSMVTTAMLLSNCDVSPTRSHLSSTQGKQNIRLPVRCDLKCYIS